MLGPITRVLAEKAFPKTQDPLRRLGIKPRVDNLVVPNLQSHPQSYATALFGIVALNAFLNDTTAQYPYTYAQCGHRTSKHTISFGVLTD